MVNTTGNVFFLVNITTKNLRDTDDIYVCIFNWEGVAGVRNRSFCGDVRKEF